MSTEKKTYRIWYKCGNCGFKWVEEPKFGTEAKADKECGHCGCKKGDPNPSKIPSF